MGSESEGGTQMHSVKKMDLMGQTEIVVNKQTRSQKPGNHIYHGTKTEGKRVVGETRNGGSEPERQYNGKHNRTRPNNTQDANQIHGRRSHNLKTEKTNIWKIRRLDLLDKGRDPG